MYDRILVPYDGSEVSGNGLELACLLAEHHKSKLVLLCVTEKDIPNEVVEAAIDEGVVKPPSYVDFYQTVAYPGLTSSAAEMRRDAVLGQVARVIAEDTVHKGAKFAEDRNIAEVRTLIRSGRPDKCILDTAKDQNVNLIVIGSRGKEGLDSLFDPSVAERVRKGADCPCLVLFPGDKD